MNPTIRERCSDELSWGYSPVCKTKIICHLAIRFIIIIVIVIIIIIISIIIIIITIIITND